MLSKISVYCLECDSEHISKLNVTVIWDEPLQHWVYNELSHPSHIYRCRDCHAESKEVGVDYGVKEYNNVVYM